MAFFLVEDVMHYGVTIIAKSEDDALATFRSLDKPVADDFRLPFQHTKVEDLMWTISLDERFGRQESDYKAYNVEQFVGMSAIVEATSADDAREKFHAEEAVTFSWSSRPTDAPHCTAFFGVESYDLLIRELSEDANSGELY